MSSGAKGASAPKPTPRPLPKQPPPGFGIPEKRSPGTSGDSKQSPRRGRRA